MTVLSDCHLGSICVDAVCEYSIPLLYKNEMQLAGVRGHQGTFVEMKYTKRVFLFCFVLNKTAFQITSL